MRSHPNDPYALPLEANAIDIAEHRATFLTGRVLLAWSRLEESILSGLGHATMSDAINSGQFPWRETEKGRFRDLLNRWIQGHLPHPPYSKSEPNLLRAEVMHLYDVRNNLAHNVGAIFPGKEGFRLSIRLTDDARKRLVAQTPNKPPPPSAFFPIYTQATLLETIERLEATHLQISKLQSERYGRDLEKRPWRGPA